VIVLVLGGTRSGKSEIAERLACGTREPVTYVATAVADAVAPLDEQLIQRIAAHRARRPAGWRTVEAATDLGVVVAALAGTVLVDSLGTWVAGAADFAVDVDALCRALRERTGTTILVSEEVGMSVHPTTDAGRAFVDALGDCNRAVAAVADRVVLAVAGRTLELGSA
jgi:adenosyl cobinamide kinase/adenosyl cobinamide phosphate guanylyltransferase